MDFAVLPPEINSGHMYAGPGSGSMVAAAAAWDGLAAQLHSTAASYSSVISGLTAGWQGASSAAMAAAAAPYAAWISGTAAAAEQAAAQARAAASAYQTAFAATVPPPVIAANRSQLAALMATNLFGQNTPAIAATEAQYADMWAQDAAAMYGYAGSAALATQLTPFTEPPQTTNTAGAAGQAAAIAHAVGTSAGTNAQSALTQLISAVPQILQSVANPPSSITTIAGAAESIGGLITGPAQGAPVVTVTSALGAYSSYLGGILDAAGPAGASSPGLGALAAGLESGMPAPGSASFGAAGSATSAGMGSAGAVGALSVPPSWAAATTMVRLAATVLHGTSAAAAPAVTVESAGSASGQLALASVAGAALGASVPRAISPTAIRGGRPTSDKDSQTPDKLKRVLAELSQKPESVQHWHTDKAHLESLLDQLSKKPGIHAVHLSAGDKPRATPPKAQWG
ncbi:MAG TPA: PPE domain-containing protein [Mycobacterium sp.]|nr:PPE domain-containing protein [Mycobacterium sp.]